MLGARKKFASKLEKLERRFAEHDEKFRVVLDAIRELMHSTRS